MTRSAIVSDRGSVHEEMFVRQRMAACKLWYHRFPLHPGVMTPGTRDCLEVLDLLDALGLPEDAAGLRVLDIGCRDGFFSFEMERRGADVLAMDRSAPDRNGFLITRELWGSRVRHEVNNVYNLMPEKNGNFDLVLFLGVLYHLRNPMMALDRIRGVMPEGATLLVESQGLDGSRLDSRGNRVIPRSLPDAFHQLGLTQFCEPGLLGREDDTNLWMPNLRGLCMMLESARFEVVQSREADSRLLVRARAVNDRRRAFMQKADYSTHVYD